MDVNGPLSIANCKKLPEGNVKHTSGSLWSVHSLGHLPIRSGLVGGIPTPLKNMSSSVGVTIPNIWKNKSHVPNH